MASALNVVQRFFPAITHVKDSGKALTIEVTKKHNNSATVKNHKTCALAVACKEKVNADGVIISLSTAYVIKDNVATRYRVPQSVSREVVSFDRNAGFSEGIYRLNPPQETAKLGNTHVGKKTHTGKGRKIEYTHHTDNVRTSLAEKETKNGKRAR